MDRQQIETPELRRILTQQAEAISEDKIRRLVNPVISMIEQGRFDRPRLITWWPQTMATVVAILVIVVVALLPHNVGSQESIFVGTLVEVPDIGIPLSITPFGGLEASTYAILPEESIEGVHFTLVNEHSNETIYMESGGESGAFIFKGVPDGSYRLKAHFTTEVSGEQSVEVGRLIVENERVEMVSDEGPNG